MVLVPSAVPIRHLHNQYDLTFRLLADPTAWRERVVEKIVIEDADDVRVMSSYQIRLPLRLIQAAWPSCRSGDYVRVLLPLTTRPKGVLLDVDLHGVPGQHCALLLKHQLARLQTDYVAWVAAARSEKSVLLEPDPLMYAISAYSPSIWKEHAEFGNRSGERRMAKYLTDGLGFEVTEDVVRAMRETAQPIEEQFGAMVETVDDATRREIAGYGRHWSVIVDTVMPVDVPTKIQLSTKRPWHDPNARRFRWWTVQNTATQRAMLGDAQSGHAEVHLNDHGVRLAARPRLRDPSGRSIKIPAVDDVRWTDDTISVYAAGDDAPAHVDMNVRMALRSPFRAFLRLLIVFGFFSFAVACLVDVENLLADAPALLVVPIAGSILLARPASGVAERLQRKLRAAVFLVVLLVCAVLMVRWGTRVVA